MVAVGELRNLIKLFGLVIILLKLVPPCWITLYEYIISFIYYDLFLCFIYLFHIGKLN